MSQKRNPWGTLFFIFSVIFSGLILAAYKIYNPQQHSLIYVKIVPVTGLFCSVLLLAAAHMTYARIHNLKVYFTGYLTGFTALLYFVIVKIPVFFSFIRVDQGFCGFVQLLIVVNLITVPLLPSYTKYKTARSTVLAFLVMESIVASVMLYSRNATWWLNKLNYTSISDAMFWVGPIAFFIILFLSVWRIKEQRHLGGVISGYSFIICVIWCSAIIDDNSGSLHLILFTGALLFLLFGIAVHWLLTIENKLMYDPLLQIFNREFCLKVISEQSKINSSAPFSVAMVDIDHFKSVNDTYGHQAGDAVLCTVARTVSEEIADKGIVCRYGGEELVVFFPGKVISDTVSIMESVRLAVEKAKTGSGKKQIKVTVSCGVSEREEESQAIAEVIAAADKALYKAKGGGRNMVKSLKCGQLNKIEKKRA